MGFSVTRFSKQLPLRSKCPNHHGLQIVNARNVLYRLTQMLPSFFIAKGV